MDIYQLRKSFPSPLRALIDPFALNRSLHTLPQLPSTFHFILLLPFPFLDEVRSEIETCRLNR